MARTLAFPVTVTGGGGFRMVEQHSDEDILGCAHMALLCPHGHRALAPEYGRPYIEFTPPTVDRAAVLRDQLLDDEPRLSDADARQIIDLETASAEVTVQGYRA